MATEPVPQHYDATQRAFHWLMAAVILLAIAIGVCTKYLPEHDPSRVALLALHKSLGMTALALVVFRVVYRLFAGAPPYSEAMSPLVRLAAHGAHWALYALMVALPLSGYVNSAAGGHDIPWFGLFTWPNVMPQDKALGHLASQAHFWLAWAIGAALALHLAAVAWHLWVKRDDVFQRMWPARTALAGGRK